MKYLFYLITAFLLFPAILIRLIADFLLVFSVNTTAGVFVFLVAFAFVFFAANIVTFSSKIVLPSSLRPIAVSFLFECFLDRIRRRDLTILFFLSAWLLLSIYMYTRNPCPINYYDCKIIATPYWFRQINGIMIPLTYTAFLVSFLSKKGFSTSSLSYFILILVSSVIGYIGGGKGSLYAGIVWPFFLPFISKILPFYFAFDFKKALKIPIKLLNLHVLWLSILFAFLSLLFLRISVSQLGYLSFYFFKNAFAQKELLDQPFAVNLSKLACSNLLNISFFLKPLYVLGLSSPFPNFGRLISESISSYGTFGGFNNSFSLILSIASNSCMLLSLIVFGFFCASLIIFISPILLASQSYKFSSTHLRFVIALPLLISFIGKLIGAPDELFQSFFLLIFILFSISILPRSYVSP